MSIHMKGKGAKSDESLFDLIPENKKGLRIAKGGNDQLRFWAIDVIALGNAAISTVQIIPKRDLLVTSFYSSAFTSNAAALLESRVVLEDLQRTLNDPPEANTPGGATALSVAYQWAFAPASSKAQVYLILRAGTTYTLSTFVHNAPAANVRLQTFVEYRPI